MDFIGGALTLAPRAPTTSNNHTRAARWASAPVRAGSDVARRYRNCARIDNPPHVFAIADAAYTAAAGAVKSQVCVVSGESVRARPLPLLSLSLLISLTYACTAACLLVLSSFALAYAARYSLS